MKLKQTLPYKLKRAVPILGLAGASLFTACEEPYLQHDTVYNWNIDNMLTALSSSQIRASADSATVRYVILNYNAKPGLGGYLSCLGTRLMIQEHIDSVSPANQHKVRGSGTLGCSGVEPADSLWLSNLGFTVLNKEQTDALWR